MDFTLQKYGELCRKLSALSFDSVPIGEFLEKHEASSEKKLVMLRHDVDRKPLNALKMAQLEAEFGIRSTYYVRAKPHTFKVDIIQEIARLGHEVGYHYESLSDAGGDMKQAIEDFENNLDRFRQVVPVKTICMHGRPLSKWDNRLLWKEWALRDFGLIGEPYISIDYSDVCYLSDTGRSWSSAAPNVRDRVSTHHGPQVATTDDVMKLLGSGQYARLLLLAHPERWSPNMRDFVLQWCKDAAANVVKGRIR